MVFRKLVAAQWELQVGRMELAFRKISMLHLSF